MKKYIEYRESGIDWVGQVPKHWEKTKLKYIGNLYSGLSGKSGEDFRKEDDPSNRPFINFTNICNNTYITRDNVGQVSINEGENQNRVEKGDLFFLMSSETQDDVGKSSVLKDEPGELYLNSFCKGFRIVDDGFDSNCINYILTGDVYRKLLSVNGKGFTRINLRQDKVNDFVFFYPPLSEQLQIVEFLDQKTSLIDTLIEKKLRKIELLKEQRTSIVNHTVTKGLNRNVKMKDSGVEWIGEIPKSWNVVKLKLICNHITDGSHFSPKTEDDGKFYITVSDITKHNTIDFSTCKKINQESFDDLVKTGCQPIKGDILLTKDGTIGRGVIVDDFTDFVILSSLGLIRLKTNMSNRYILYYLLSGLNIEQMYSNIRGSGITRLTITLIKDLFIIVPTSEEQPQIVEYLDKKTNEIDTTITLENKKIDLLKEYRQSLISEIVTGKIDVRKN